MKNVHFNWKYTHEALLRWDANWYEQSNYFIKHDRKLPNTTTTESARMKKKSNHKINTYRSGRARTTTIIELSRIASFLRFAYYNLCVSNNSKQINFKKIWILLKSKNFGAFLFLLQFVDMISILSLVRSYTNNELNIMRKMFKCK